MGGRNISLQATRLITGISVPPYVPPTSEQEVLKYGVSNLGVADYRKVEQEICCYIPGEVSHIENILAKEYKEKSTRNLISSERTFETSSEREMEKLADTVSTERNEMSSEIVEVINNDRSVSASFNAKSSGKIFGQEVSASYQGGFGLSRSTSQSNAIAKTYAEDVTRRALERVVQKVSSKRTSRILREFEETNKHGFDNREGTQHVTGIYRWIDKVYTNRLLNYGKRLTFEFMLPEPARFYKQAIIIEAEEQDGGSGGGNVLVEPTHPSKLTNNPIASASDLTRENYDEVAAIYGISLDAPADEIVHVTQSYQEFPQDNKLHIYPPFSNLADFRASQDYICEQVRGVGSFRHKADNNNFFNISVARASWNSPKLTGKGTVPFALFSSNLHIGGSIHVLVVLNKTEHFSFELEAKCHLKASVFAQWQQDTYAEIMRAYNEQFQAYKDAKAEQDLEQKLAEEDGELSRNPRFNAQIVQTELKRLCIEMLLKPFGIQQGENFYQKDTKCDVPYIKMGSLLATHAQRAKFLEQAFD